MVYPTSLDTFDRPTSGVDSQDNPDSATLANDHSTAIEQLQVKVGTGTSPAAAADAGQVMTADGAGAGTWQDLPTIPSDLDDLSDVDTSTSAPAVGDALVWDGANWVPDTTRKAPSTALWLPRSTGNYVSTPDHADLQIVGELDLRLKVAGWDPAIASMEFISRRSTTGGSEYSFRKGVAGSAALELYWQGSGGGFVTPGASTAEVVPPADGSLYWIRVTRAGTAGDWTIRYYTSNDYDPERDTGTWTQLGADVTSAGAAPASEPGRILSIGAHSGGTSSTLEGLVQRAMVLDGIGGTIAADFRSDAPMGARYRDQTGKVWSINGSAWAWEVAA